MLTKRWLSKITPNLWREYCVNTTLKEGQMYILIVETQFHRCLRQIEVVEYKCENGYGYGYPDGYPDILYPILLHHWLEFKPGNQMQKDNLTTIIAVIFKCLDGEDGHSLSQLGQLNSFS